MGDGHGGGEAERGLDGEEDLALYLEQVVQVVDGVGELLAQEVEVGDEREAAHLRPQREAAALGLSAVGAAGAVVLDVDEDGAVLVDVGGQHVGQLGEVARQDAGVDVVDELAGRLVHVRDGLVVDGEALGVQRDLEERQGVLGGLRGAEQRGGGAEGRDGDGLERCRRRRCGG